MGIKKFLLEESSGWGTNLQSNLSTILIAIFAVVGALAVVYAIYLGFLLAKAEDAGKRQQAKKRIFNALSGLLIIVVLTSIFATYDFWADISKDASAYQTRNQYSLKTDAEVKDAGILITFRNIVTGDKILNEDTMLEDSKADGKDIKISDNVLHATEAGDIDFIARLNIGNDYVIVVGTIKISPDESTGKITTGGKTVYTAKDGNNPNIIISDGVTDDGNSHSGGGASFGDGTIDRSKWQAQFKNVVSKCYVSDSDFDLLARLVCCESGGEPFLGQVAVASSFLNRLVYDEKAPYFGGFSVQEVISYPNAYSPYPDKVNKATANESNKSAVQLALEGFDPTEQAKKGGLHNFVSYAYYTANVKKFSGKTLLFIGGIKGQTLKDQNGKSVSTKSMYGQVFHS